MISKSLHLACASSTGAISLLFGLAFAGELAPAEAKGGRSGAVRTTEMAAPPHEPGPFAHGSVLRISEHEPLPIVRAIRLGRNKSMVVELPRELRDVVVSNPEVIDAVVQSSNRVFLIAKSKATGQANVFFFDSKGNQILTLEMTVDRDSMPLEAFLNRHITGARIKVEILHDSIVLTGAVRNPIDSSRASDVAARFAVMPAESAEQNSRSDKKVINLLKVDGEEQVMLKVVVAEMQRTLLKQLGINLAADITSGNFTTSLMTANALPLTAALGLGGMPIPGYSSAVDPNNGCAGTTCFYNQGPAAGTYSNNGVTNHWRTGNQGFSQAVRMLERDGLFRTLAEPNLTAVSGEPAKFLVGGEYPIPMTDGSGRVSITYKEYGVGLSFTPVVFSEGRISLKIETEVSELTDAGAVTISSLNVPALRKRQARSTVELPSGGSLALAGLLSEDTRQSIDGTPGLRNLPVLGALFRSRDFVKRETELVVIVTPYVIKPTARHNLARPDDGFAAATDMKGNFLGHINRIYGKSQVPPSGGLKGNYGFIVE